MLFDKVTYNHKVVEIARISRGIGQSQLADMLDVKQGTISKWERGELFMKEEFYEKVSDLLQYPLSLFKQNIIILPDYLVYYRKKKSLKKIEVDKIKYSLHILKYGVKELLKSVDIPNNVIYLNTTDNGCPEDIAKFVRQKWKIPQGPIDNLVQWIEKAGILVFAIDAPQEFDGQVLPDEEGLPIICVNRNFTGDRLRNTLAHELGHLIMHTNYMPKKDDDYEDEAKRFAAEFLMPEKDIWVDLNDGNLTLQKLASLKSYWGVSMSSLVYRAKELNIIDENKKVSLYVQLGQHGFRKLEPTMGVFPEVPNLVKQLIDLHLKDLEYSEEDVANLMGFSLEEFKKIYGFYNKKVKLRIA